MEIDINTLAPWVAIAVTLILSILVPLFTQIANNRFQLKKAKEERILSNMKEKLTKKTTAYEHFLMDVAAAIEYRTKDTLPTAGASIGRIYLYAPSKWHSKIDNLYRAIRTGEWGNAELLFFELSKLMSEEYSQFDSSITSQDAQ